MKLEDQIVKSLSTWKFAFIHLFIVVLWCVINYILPEHLQFDPYPFIFLNFIVSLWSMWQNQIIMISQYKLTESDRRLASDNAEDTKKILNAVKKLEAKLLDKLEDIEENLDDEEEKK